MFNINLLGFFAVYIPNGAVIACIVLAVLIVGVATLLIYLQTKRTKALVAQQQRQAEQAAAQTPQQTIKPIPKRVEYSVVKDQPVVIYNSYVQPETNRHTDANTFISTAGTKQSVATKASETVLIKDSEVTTKSVVKIRLNRSYLSKIIQAEDEIKQQYSYIKNALLNLEGVSSHISWQGETFFLERKKLAILAMRTNTLCLYLAVQPAQYADRDYPVEDVSQTHRYVATPTLLRLESHSRTTYAKNIIADLAALQGVKRGAEVTTTNWAKQNYYRSDNTLLQEKLIKEVYYKVKKATKTQSQNREVLRQVSVVEARKLISDEQARSFVKQGNRLADKTKSGIVNVDTLAATFKAGETVTLQKIKKRIYSVDKKVTYIKVLARGILDKPLNVEADEYSIDAIKMIVLTGGTVIKSSK